MKQSCFSAILVLFIAAVSHADSDSKPNFLVIILDGLRPDYITEDLMPNLHALGESGVVGEAHHAVFPTVTRVNSPSIATGTYPGTHGLMGNTVYLPQVDPERTLSTSDARNLFRIDEATDGELLTAPSLGEVLDKEGLELLAVSSGSTGSAFLLDHTLAGGGVINVGMILPESQADRVVELIGPAPPDSLPATARNAWVVDAYVELGLKRLKPAVTLMWLTDPDHTAHDAGIGAPLTLEAIRGVDAEIGRILRVHEEMGVADRTNILVTADHGFSTHTGGFNLFQTLKESGLSDGATVTGGAIYLERNSHRRVSAIVEAIRAKPWAGPIFTRAKEPGSDLGWIDGTLSFELIHWGHERAADILVAPSWDDHVNDYGYAGRTSLPGVAGHGSTSPFDIHAPLVAAGPSFKSALTSSTPTANVDIAPTILRVLGIDAPAAMLGRPIRELLVGGPLPEGVEVRTRTVVAESDTHRTSLSESTVEGRRYVDYARVTARDPR